jgi:Peptidase family M48
VILLALGPLLLGIVTATTSRRAADRIAPGVATVVLTALALTVALATGLLLCVAAGVAAAELIPASSFGDWSSDVLRDNIPMPPAVGVGAGALAVALLCASAVHLARVALGTRRFARAAAGLLAHGDLVVVPDESMFAYAVPGRQRRIVASTGMLSTLSGPQRRALLAHEDAHLRFRHHVYVQLARLAAAANPLMRPVSRAVELSVERWADAVAAGEVGDRATVAHALATAAIGAARVPGGALAATGNDVVARVRTLLDPVPRRRPLAALLVGAALGCWVTAAVVVVHVHALLETAEAVAAR